MGGIPKVVLAVSGGDNIKVEVEALARDGEGGAQIEEGVRHQA